MQHRGSLMSPAAFLLAFFIYREGTGSTRLPTSPYVFANQNQKRLQLCKVIKHFGDNEIILYLTIRSNLSHSLSQFHSLQLKSFYVLHCFEEPHISSTTRDSTLSIFVAYSQISKNCRNEHATHSPFQVLSRQIFIICFMAPSSNAQTTAAVTRGGARSERASSENITIKGNFESLIIHVKQNYFAPQLGKVGKELCV